MGFFILMRSQLINSNVLVSTFPFWPSTHGRIDPVAHEYW